MVRKKADRMSDLAVTVFRLNGVLTSWGDDFSAPEGLSSARWQMLGAVALADRPSTTPQIAARMGVTRQGAQKQLNALVEAGLMEVRPNPLHKRSPLYLLTQQGQTAFDAMDKRWRAHAARTAASFDDAELDTALKVLTGLIDLYASAKQEPHDEA